MICVLYVFCKGSAETHVFRAASRCEHLVAVGREGEEEDEEDQAGGGDEPQLEYSVGADEEDHLVRARARGRARVRVRVG